MKIALTGHRSEHCEPENITRTKLRNALSDVPQDTIVICGMANGVDLWGGTEALDLGMPVIAAKPWAGHGPRKSDVALYERIIAEAVEVVNVNESQVYLGPWLYQNRNEWMVDNATNILAYYNGAPNGGTFNCLKYANKLERPVRNVYGKTV